jgi:hypothetical protein
MIPNWYVAVSRVDIYRPSNGLVLPKVCHDHYLLYDSIFGIDP